MQFKYTLTALFVFQFLFFSGCSAESIKLEHYELKSNVPEAINKIIALSRSNCSKIYKSKNIWLLEQHCSNEKSDIGIYILDSSGLRKFSWYDAEFNKWAWSEGCNDDNECYYKVLTDSSGKVTEIFYYFFINLSEGFYKLTIKNQKLIIDKKEIKDHPS